MFSNPPVTVANPGEPIMTLRGVRFNMYKFSMKTFFIFFSLRLIMSIIVKSVTKNVRIHITPKENTIDIYFC